MYDVFLVDDEIVLREGIRSNIHWDETPFNLVGEAPDGEMALSMIKELKPDILITDIRMPFLDGLELARIIRKEQPWVKIIILSGHDEFRYAREAISIGVEEYLLKPFSSAELLEILHKVAASIEEEKEQIVSLENLRNQVLSSKEIFRDRWLRELAAGLVSPAGAIEEARDLGIELISGAYAVAIVKVKAPEGRKKELPSARLFLKSHLSKRADVIFFSERPGRHVLIVKESKEESVEETAYSLAQGLKSEVTKQTGCPVSIGIGRAVKRIGEIPLSYEEADRVSRFMGERGQQLILGAGDMDSSSGEISLLPPESCRIAGRLKYAAAGEIDVIMEEYLSLFGDSESYSPFFSNYLLGDIIIASTAIIGELGGDVHEVIPSFLLREKLNNMISSRESFILHVRDLIEKVLAFRDSQGKGKHYEMIRKANEYIDSHFADPDICLHSVAEHVNASPNHFSTVYSQETGRSFIEYLTSVRIGKAKYLLRNTELRSSDIAYEAGFNDPHYFSFIFKKNVGLSPRDFRSEKIVHSLK
ncbi:response regulator [Spirochaeta isovalerica]|uniref:Two-component system response regulator YesN n=1 Tax=Spirochaeta isovalerica TaxID=150 RepID=A0A841R7P7_9SPIO|nr:response regulator [Spirochaeta isovalerica]MBB6479217.1 two-component system response regulator YesN [Spirochaeta isovalerica]